MGRRGGSEMKATKDRMNFGYSRNALRLTYGIDDPGMTTAGNHHQPAAADVEARRMLVPVLVRHDPALMRNVGEMPGVATDPVPLAVFDPGIWQHCFEAVPLDPAR